MIDPIPITTGYCEHCAAHPVPVVRLGHEEPATICRDCLREGIGAIDAQPATPPSRPR